jgi:hypothetical protein
MINNVKDLDMFKRKSSSDEKDKQISRINHLDSDSVTLTTSNSTFPDYLFQHRRVIFVPKFHQEIL